MARGGAGVHPCNGSDGTWLCRLLEDPLHEHQHLGRMRRDMNDGEANQTEIGL